MKLDTFLSILFSFCIIAYAFRFLYFVSICKSGCTGILPVFPDMLDVVLGLVIGGYFLSKGLNTVLKSLRTASP